MFEFSLPLRKLRCLMITSMNGNQKLKRKSAKINRHDLGRSTLEKLMITDSLQGELVNEDFSLRICQIKHFLVSLTKQRSHRIMKVLLRMYYNGMKMQCIKIICISMIFCFLSMYAIAQTKKALIIGNDDYIEFSNLRFSIEENYNLRESLIDMGYDVTLVRNGTRDQMFKAFNDYFQKDASISLLYYSGHIYKNKSSGDVYLVPIDAEIRSWFVDESKLIPINHIRNLLSKSIDQYNVLIFDLVSNFGFDKIQEDVVESVIADTNKRNTIVLANNNSQKLPFETSWLLKSFQQELKNTQQTIKESIENLSRKSLHNSLMNISVFTGEFNPNILWGDKASTMDGIEIMPSFPFPPPKASASYLIDKKHFREAGNLFEVSEILDTILISCGYYERSYYQIPKGFALVTRIEKIELDASPCPPSERWNAPHNEDISNFSIADYFRSLFRAEIGKYRIIVFLVTSMPFSQSEKKMTLADAEKYLKKGNNILPKEFKLIKLTDDYNCTALIYEFDKVEYEEGVQVEHSRFLGYEHLKKNNFLPLLINRNK